MILTQLYKLYDRLSTDPEAREKLPRQGTSVQQISFVVVLSENGTLVDIQDGTIDGKKTRKLLVPGPAHPPGSAATPRFLWDKSSYIFGLVTEKESKKEKDPKKRNKAIQKAKDELFPSYRDLLHQLIQKYAIKDNGILAIDRFLQSWDPSNIPPEWKEKMEAYCTNFGVFRLEGSSTYIHDVPLAFDIWNQYTQSLAKQPILGNCLISGAENIPIVATVETQVKVRNATGGGGAIASFNAKAYESYGKEKTFNSPLSDDAAFKAHNALNFLIAEKKHRFYLGGTTVVFWTEKKTITENIFSLALDYFDAPDEESQDTATLKHIREFWKAVNKAGDPDLSGLHDDTDTPFYMLGIEANAARVVIRFWQEGTLRSLVMRLRQHLSDMRIEKPFEKSKDIIPLPMILRQTARVMDEVPPLLGAELLRSVINGLPYPQSLYQLTLNRINVSHKDPNGKYNLGHKVSYEQASIVKAFLVRNKQHGELTMALNPENKAPAYLLGRLFATLEKTQDESSGGVNAGVGDKYYSAASSTPRIVFPTLLDLYRKHVQKLQKDNPGLAVIREKLVCEILDSIDSTAGFPANLDLEERGLFAIGYYQQMRKFFEKKNSSPNPEQDSDNN